MKPENCAICKKPLGTFKAFVVEAGAVLSRTTKESPLHKDCALNYAKKMKTMKGASAVIALVWITIHYDVFEADRGVVFELGDCEEVSWFIGGRKATRKEVEKSVDSFIPSLQKLCKDWDDRYELERRKKIAVALYPEA